jgi:methylglutaconyl-CoA hydratase
MLNGKVEGSLKNGVGEITFSSEKANCLDSRLLKELIAQVKKFSEDKDCKVLYLKSEGKTFCAGAYLDELKSIKSESDATAFFALFGELSVSLREASQPVVVRVQGPVVGGGLGILAAADLAFGVSQSSARLSEFDVGIGPFVVSVVIEAKIGGPRLMELALCGVSKDSNWCLSTGLLSEVAPDVDQLDVKIKDTLAKICTYSLDNTTALKRIVTASNLRKLVAERAIIAGKALLRA